MTRKRLYRWVCAECGAYKRPIDLQPRVVLDPDIPRWHEKPRDLSRPWWQNYCGPVVLCPKQ